MTISNLISIFCIMGFLFDVNIENNLLDLPEKYQICGVWSG